METKTKIGLLEEPMVKLIDARGRNWKAQLRGPLGSKQILIGSLLALGYDVNLVNLKRGSSEWEFGETKWRGMKMKKIAVGMPWDTVDPKECDVWGLTINFLQEREISCKIIEYLSSGGGRVVVGGSDVFTEPKPYLEAGASVTVMDKSGMSNAAAIATALGQSPEGCYRLYTKEKGLVQNSGHFSRLHPENWPLPPVDFVRQTLVEKIFSTLPEGYLGAVMWDHGCDRHCDFCQTPTYKLGYQYMSPARALEWLSLQKAAGAYSVQCLSDQFLGRILYKNGRKEIMEIMKGLRDMKMSVVFKNGLELAKASLGRGLPNGDPTPDEELVKAVWGWDGEAGCAFCSLPAERPLEGPVAYAKLLPWKQHAEMVKAIVKAGVPDLTYALIIGFPDDSDEKMKQLLASVLELKEKLLKINPRLLFRIRAANIAPIPGTPDDRKIRKEGLLRFTDPIIVGGHWTACADTRHMSYEEVSEWQRVFFKTSRSEEVEQGHQGITAFD